MGLGEPVRDGDPLRAFRLAVPAGQAAATTLAFFFNVLILAEPKPFSDARLARHPRPAPFREIP